VTDTPARAPVDPRAALAGARRIVVKVGSSSLTTAAGGLDPALVDALVDALATGPAAQTVLVSSGAIAAGLAPLGLPARPRDLATQQAAAAVGQGVLVADYSRSFARHRRTVAQVLLTADDVVRRTNYRNAERALDRLLGLGVLPVINENDTVATEEIRFGDNDRLAALVAHVVRADALLLLSDVDGLYDAPPARRGSTRIDLVEDPADLDPASFAGSGSAVGTGGMATKVQAAGIATAAGIPVVLAAAADAARALAGEAVGTAFAARGHRFRARTAWLAYASRPAGALHLDAGAAAAVTGRGASLLAAGVTGAEGRFAAGDPVDLVGPDGTVLARGLVGFDIDEVGPMLGRSTTELAAAYGPERARELVHRDALALLAPTVAAWSRRSPGRG
jgi:glutamate 5-kinase